MGVRAFPECVQNCSLPGKWTMRNLGGCPLGNRGFESLPVYHLWPLNQNGPGIEPGPFGVIQGVCLAAGLFAVLGELCVEDDLARWEVDLFAEGGGFRGSELAVHGAVFPLD